MEDESERPAREHGDGARSSWEASRRARYAEIQPPPDADDGAPDTDRDGEPVGDERDRAGATRVDDAGGADGNESDGRDGWGLWESTAETTDRIAATEWRPTSAAGEGPPAGRAPGQPTANHDDDGTDGEPPLPTEPRGSGQLDPCPNGEIRDADQAVWADEPMRPDWRVPASAATAAGGDPRRRTGYGPPAERRLVGRRPAVGVRAAAAGTDGVWVAQPHGSSPVRRAGRRGRVRSPEALARARRVRADITALVVYLVGAAYVLQRLIPDPVGRVQSNVADQTFFQWMLAYGARIVTHRDDPLFTSRLGAPTGVNMIANTSVLGISVPLSPVTLLFGPAVSYLVFSLVALAGTAAAWYYVLSRHVVRSRLAAAVGGGLAGFAPAMISHSYGHPNIVAQFLVPFIVWRTLRLRERGHALRNGLLLGLLVAWQAFINEEILLITAIGLVVFLLAYAAMRPSVVRGDALPLLRGVLVAVLVAGAILAYPLWVEFRGPQHGNGANTAGPRPYPADVLSFPSFASDSLAGQQTVIGRLAQNVSEQNSFFGWPLLILLGAATIVMRRSRVYLAGCVVALVLTALSLGSHVTIGGREAGVSGPWSLVAHLPLFRQVVPTRVAVEVAPVIAVLVALAHDRIATAAARRRDPLGPANLVWHGALIAALVPLVPTPLHAGGRPPIPPFITQGTWHEYVDEHHTLLSIPSAAPGRLEPMRWAATTNAGFAIPGGYFLAPDGSFGERPRVTNALLDRVADTGRVPFVGGRQRADAVADLRFWRASAVVVVPGFHTDAVTETGTELFGFRPRYVAGLWVWDVRDLLSGQGDGGQPDGWDRPGG